MVSALHPWRTEPAPPGGDPIGTIEVALPGGVPERMTHTAAGAGVPVGAVLVAAAARVFGLMCGDGLVDLQVRVAGLAHGAVHVELTGRSWRQVLTTIVPAPPTAPPSRHGVGDTEDVPDDVDVWVRMDHASARLTVRHRVDRVDTAHAGRIAGYVVAAIDAATAPDDDLITAADLLGSSEVAAQLDLGRGPVRDAPAEFATDLVAGIATAAPGAIALITPDVTWTYGELWQRTADLAALLRERGVVEEDVVAVAVERGADWAASVLAVLAVGAVYLPVDPDHPADRIAAVLDRAACRFALVTPGTQLPVAVVVPVDAAAHGSPPPPRPPISPQSPAYIYFTSGSTGSPKGAICEHAGMVNHLAAKVDDLGLTCDDVVVQSAAATFDISMWQLLAPLTLGGRSVIVPRRLQTDVAGFLDRVVAVRATVVQVVPSYLEALLMHLDTLPRPLGALRMLSVTGEAVSRSLVGRWLAHHPDIPVVNAYGATEASDDTTHEVMHTPPDNDLVPVGRPVRNVQVHVLEPGTMRLQPLGCVGEIAFSGVCVGRGYINDETATLAAFGTDPYRQGARLYRTGDFGRWLPSGSIEFHGRRDEQVKIRGFRIELGEVEARLQEVPGVRTGAAVLLRGTGPEKQLAAFYTGDAATTPDDVRAGLVRGLPAAAVPTTVRHLDALPLNANGKIDKAALARLAAPVLTPGGVPLTPTEARIACAWAGALGIDAAMIRPDADFFDLGGSSLSALRVLIALGGLISIEHLLGTPVLRVLAELADTTPARTGPRPMLRRLSVPRSATTVLVCLPYAGGGAQSFRSLAEAVAASGAPIAVYAVQSPGHDLGDREEALVEVAPLADAVAAEVARLGLPTVLWAQEEGAAAALATAAALQRSGAPVRHLLIASRPWSDAAQLARELRVLGVATDADLGAAVAATDGLDGLAPADLAFVGRTYRHDVGAAARYLTVALEWSTRPLVEAITVVGSVGDPAPWRRFAHTVDTVPVKDGGPRFCRTRPETAAALVLRVAA